MADRQIKSSQESRGRDIVVIGASAGGVEALRSLVHDLPPKLAAAIFVVVHFPANYSSILPEILTRSGPLPARHARDGERIEPGRIYVAPPDHHLLLHRGCMRLSHGPHENAHRPAVDPLFRTAARAYGPRVIGVVLTGNLDDGTAGLGDIKERGGAAIVQLPSDAVCASMPQSAIDNVEVDRVVPLKQIAKSIVELTHARVDGGTVWRRKHHSSSNHADYLQEEADMAETDADQMQLDDRPGEPSGFTCPECGGALWELKDKKLLRFRCRTGHAYSVQTLMTEQTTGVESALWAAMATLKEKSSLVRRMADQAQQRGQSVVVPRLTRQADAADRDVEILRRVLLGFKNQMEPEAARGRGDRAKAPDAPPIELPEETKGAECEPAPRSSSASQRKRAWQEDDARRASRKSASGNGGNGSGDSGRIRKSEAKGKEM